MGFLLNRELTLYNNEVRGAKAALDSEKVAFEQYMKNGFGDEIINELNNPTKFSTMFIIKLKIKRFFDRLKNLNIEQ